MSCVWADGVNRTPTLHFSHNPAYASDYRDCAQVNNLFKDLDLLRDRTFYLKSTKYYCAESNEQVTAFRDRYKAELKGTHVMHDGGPAWKIKGDFVLADTVNKVRVLAPAQHGELSVNDNNVHSIIKAQWKAKFDHKLPEWADALYLLKLTDTVKSDSIAGMFNRNFLFDEKEITLTAVEACLTRNHSWPSPRERFRSTTISLSEVL
jgi:hypothetical protein